MTGKPFLCSALTYFDIIYSRNCH